MNYPKGIYKIENFLSQEEIDVLLSSIEGDGFAESHPGNVTKDLNSESLEIMPLIGQRLMSYFDKAHSHIEIRKIMRLQKGQAMPIHSDGGYPDNEMSIVFGIAIYLNDNFGGGELYYPNLDIKIKPEKGSLVLHDAKLLHGVLPVTSGTRYAITTFIFGNEDTKFKYSS